MNYKSSSELKSLAKGQLLGKYNVVIPATLLVALMTTFISFFASSFVSDTTVFGIAVNLLISFMVDIITGVFIVGQIVMNLNIICKKPYFVSDIYYGFHFHTNKIIIVKSVIAILELLVSLPFIIFTNILEFHFSYTLMSAVLLSFIPAMVITVLLELNLSMSYYLLVDFPDYTWKEVLKLSVKIMKGHKGRLFYIMVSFIPMFLLGLLPFGIGLLWVAPYYRMTITNFYLDLISEKN